MKTLKDHIVFVFIFIFVFSLFSSNTIFATVFDSMESESLLHSNLSSTFDESSLFFNPTVISKSKMYELHSNDKSFSSLSLTTSFSKGSIPFYSIISATSAEGLKSLFRDDSFQKGSFLLLKQMQLKDSYYLTVGFFSKAMVQSMSLKDYVDNSSANDRFIHSLSDSGMVLNIPIISYENRINMALGIWGLYRSGISTRIEGELSQDKIDQSLNSGFMYGADLGLGYVLNDFWSPGISVVLSNISGKCINNYLGKYGDKNICGASMIGGSVKDLNSYNIIEPANLKIGASVNPRFSKNFSVRFNSALENIPLTIGNNDYYNPDRKSIVSSSVEALFGNPFKDTPLTLRVAFNSESMVYSAKINISHFSLSFSHIEEEKEGLIPQDVKTSLTGKSVESKTVAKYLIGMKVRL